MLLSPTLSNASLFARLYNTPPKYLILHLFGCTICPFLRPYNSHKIHFCTTLCIYPSSSPSHHGHHCLDPLTQRIYIARHVRFDFTTFLGLLSSLHQLMLIMMHGFPCNSHLLLFLAFHLLCLPHPLCHTFSQILVYRLLLVHLFYL